MRPLQLSPVSDECRKAALPEVYSTREVARAAGLGTRRIRELVAAGRIRTVDGEFISEREARRVVREARAGIGLIFPLSPEGVAERPLFGPLEQASRATAVPLAVSSGLHVAAVAGVLLLSSLGLGTAAEPERLMDAPTGPLRLVYLTLPGPGGGGGGGGLRQRTPPPRSRREGAAKTVSSPLPERKPPVATPVEKPAEDRPLRAEPLPPIVAPVVTVAGDPQTRAGVLETSPSEADSRGPGVGGGVGSGSGTGLGEGDGPGIGPGSGGGTGGGPYRPGSGIEPPRLLREIKPDYTEDARRRGVEGDVVMEIVIRRDGSVGEVRILGGLGYGLDQRAADAVRQWRFAPARRQGSPVDVIVEVAVEFRLR